MSCVGFCWDRIDNNMSTTITKSVGSNMDTRTHHPVKSPVSFLYTYGLQSLQLIYWASSNLLLSPSIRILQSSYPGRYFLYVLAYHKSLSIGTWYRIVLIHILKSTFTARQASLTLNTACLLYFIQHRDNFHTSLFTTSSCLDLQTITKHTSFTTPIPLVR